MLTRFRNFSIRKDSYFNSFQTTNVNKIPRYLDLPDVGDEPGMIGDIILNITERSLCYHNGITWECLTGSGGPVSLINIGGGAGIYSVGTGPDPFELKSLVSTDGSVVITDLGDEIDLTTTGGGVPATGLNIGGGSEIYVDATAPNFEFRTLVSLNPDLTITQTLDTIEFDLLVNPGGVSSLLNVGIGANPDPNDRFIVYNGQPNLPNTDPAEIRTLRGALNQAVATLEAEDVIINDPLTNPNPETDGNVVGTEIVDNLIVQVSVAGSDLNDGISAPVATLERALEIVRFRNFVETALIEVGAGTFSITDEMINFNVGTRGREKQALLIRGVAEPVGTQIPLSSVSFNPISDLLELTHPSFSASLEGEMIGLTYTNNSGNVVTARVLLGEYNTLTGAITVEVSEQTLDINVFQPISYQLFDRQTIINLPQVSVWKSDKFPVIFQNIIFQSEFAVIEILNMSMYNVNIVYRTTIDMILKSQDSIFSTLVEQFVPFSSIVFNDLVPEEQRLTGIFFDASFEQDNVSIFIFLVNSFSAIFNTFFKGFFDSTFSNFINCLSVDTTLLIGEQSWYNNRNTCFQPIKSILTGSNVNFIGCENVVSCGNSLIDMNEINIDNTISTTGSTLPVFSILDNSSFILFDSFVSGGPNFDFNYCILAQSSSIDLDDVVIRNINADNNIDTAAIFANLCNVFIIYGLQTPMFSELQGSALKTNNCNVIVEFRQNTTLIDIYNLNGQNDPCIDLKETSFNISGNDDSSILLSPNTGVPVQVNLEQCIGKFSAFRLIGNNVNPIIINEFLNASVSNISLDEITMISQTPSPTPVYTEVIYRFDTCNVKIDNNFLVGGSEEIQTTAQAINARNSQLNINNTALLEFILGISSFSTKILSVGLTFNTCTQPLFQTLNSSANFDSTFIFGSTISIVNDNSTLIMERSSINYPSYQTVVNGLNNSSTLFINTNIIVPEPPPGPPGTPVI